MSLRQKSTALLVAGLAIFSQSVPGQLSKATKIFINRGVELQAMVACADEFNLATYTNANYTSVNWFDPGYQPLLGPAPGFPWGRWVSGTNDMPPQDPNVEYRGYNNETNYMSQLINLELGDELNLNDPTTYSNEVSWITNSQPFFTNTILFINNYAGQASDATLVGMLTQGQADLICFDNYPFQATYDTNYPNDTGPSNTWPFTSWFSELRRYRQDAMNCGAPFGTYMQTFNSVEGYDTRVYRNPSASELRFNNFAALAFNAKMLIGFVYNSGAAALFNILPNGYSGDTYTNALYNEQVDVNHRAVILGRTLACLQPVYDLHNPHDSPAPPGPASGSTSFPDGTTTSIVIAKGNPGTSTNTGEPIGFQDATGTNSTWYSWFEYGKNDPYLHDWTVVNKGTNNGGSPGQVIISWFRPLDENLDGPNYTNEVYIMVVNALTANTGASADCAQQITLNFQGLPGNITAVNMLDLEGGVVTNAPLILFGRTQIRQLFLTLNGGDAALFKYADGAPFIGHVAPARPQLSVVKKNGLAAVTVQGTPLARYEAQSSPSLINPNWTAVGYQILTNSSAVFMDPWSSTNTVFYRAVGIP